MGYDWQQKVSVKCSRKRGNGKSRSFVREVLAEYY